MKSFHLFINRLPVHVAQTLVPWGSAGGAGEGLDRDGSLRGFEEWIPCSLAPFPNPKILDHMEQCTAPIIIAARASTKCPCDIPFGVGPKAVNPPSRCQAEKKKKVIDTFWGGKKLL